MGQPRISLKTTGTDQFHISWTAHQFNLQIRKQSLQTIASHSEAFDKAWPLSNRPHRLGASSLRMAVRPLGLGNSHYRLFSCKTRSTDNPGDKPAGCGRNLIGRSDLWALPSFARSPTFLMPEAPIAAHRNFILGLPALDQTRGLLLVRPKFFICTLAYNHFQLRISARTNNRISTSQM